MEHSDDQKRLTAFDEHRGLLSSIAYRMLGSVADAEDILQETFIRWQQAADEDIRSPKAFLITIITRLSINHLQSARVRREEYVGQWLPEPLVIGKDNVQAEETLSIAFLVLLERLSATERAVFDYEYAEIAAALGLSEANCRQILRRAKEHVRAERPRFKATAEEHDVLLGRFQEAVLSGDVGAIESLLSADVVLHTDGGGKAPALLNLVHGANNVARAIIGGNLDGRVFGVFTIQVHQGRIAAIYGITNPDKLAHLPGLVSQKPN